MALIQLQMTQQNSPLSKGENKYNILKNAIFRAKQLSTDKWIYYHIQRVMIKVCVHSAYASFYQYWLFFTSSFINLFLLYISLSVVIYSTAVHFANMITFKLSVVSTSNIKYWIFFFHLLYLHFTVFPRL